MLKFDYLSNRSFLGPCKKPVSWEPQITVADLPFIAMMVDPIYARFSEWIDRTREGTNNT